MAAETEMCVRMIEIVAIKCYDFGIKLVTFLEYWLFHQYDHTRVY